jgi:GntR family transcriptional regulator
MLVSIDENDSLPIYLQIVRQVKEQMLVGELHVGDELPSVRELGDALGISLHTARSAYQTLSEEGLLRVRLGKKARIAERIGKGGIRSSSRGYATRLRELVVDGMLQGLAPEEIHELLDREVRALRAREQRSTGKESS